MSERKRRHFNKATVYGSLLKTPELKETEETGKKYASFQIQCANDLHGNVRVYGKIWGDRAVSFVGAVKAGDKIRLEGVLQQYKNDQEQLVTNFVFFNWEPCTEKQAKELRAVFIMVGEVTGLTEASSDEEGRHSDQWEVEVLFEQEATEERQARSETFLFRMEKGEGQAPELIGETVQLAGVLEQPADYFGNTKPTRPMIKEIRAVSAFIQEKGDRGMEGDGEVPF